MFQMRIKSVFLSNDTSRPIGEGGGEDGGRRRGAGGIDSWHGSDLDIEWVYILSLG